MIIGCPLSLVRHQQLLQRTSPPKQLAGFLPNLAVMILTWPSLIIVQMVMAFTISQKETKGGGGGGGGCNIEPI